MQSHELLTLGCRIGQMESRFVLLDLLRSG